MFQITWNITAGNLSPVNDAAAAVFITSAEGTSRLGVKRSAKRRVSPTRPLSNLSNRGPQVQAAAGPVWPPRRSNHLDRLGNRQVIEVVGDLRSLADAEIAREQDVLPVEAEPHRPAGSASRPGPDRRTRPVRRGNGSRVPWRGTAPLSSADRCRR